MGYDHFAVNNLSYHGTDLTIVWQKPGSGAYPLAPAGYSLYVGGKRVLTVDRPGACHVELGERCGRRA